MIFSTSRPGIEKSFADMVCIHIAVLQSGFSDKVFFIDTRHCSNTCLVYLFMCKNRWIWISCI